MLAYQRQVGARYLIIAPLQEQTADPGRRLMTVGSFNSSNGLRGSASWTSSPWSRRLGIAGGLRSRHHTSAPKSALAPNALKREGETWRIHRFRTNRRSLRDSLRQIGTGDNRPIHLSKNGSNSTPPLQRIAPTPPRTSFPTRAWEAQQ